MAPSAQVLLSFLFILVLFSSPQVQARESQFFSKVTRYSSPKEAAKEPSSEYPDAPVSDLTPTPAPAPGPASELFQPDNEDGHGLYGRGSNEFSPTTTTTTVGENEVVPEELAGESYEELEETRYSNNNHGDTTKNYNYNGYTTEQQGMSDTRFLENGKYAYNTNGYSNKYNNGYSTTSNNNGYSTTSNNNGYSTTSNNNGYSTTSNNNGYSTTSNNNGYSTTSNNNGYSNKYNNGYSTTSNYNGHSTEKQGMSDTRFLANGKYYYDVNNQNNNYVDGYNTEKGSTYKEGYYSNTQNSNEFNNSMEEYQGQQEYQEGQEEYVP